jgi:hypothetical protein
MSQTIINMDELTEQEVIIRIKMYLKEAERYANFKTPEEEKKLDILLAQAEALQSLMRWIKA